MTDSYNTPWRKTATAIYGPPRDGKIFGTIELDVTDALEFIEQQRAAGAQLTITHLITSALARALAHDVPEINCYVRRGRIVPREHADVAVAVKLTSGTGVGVVCIRKAEQKSLPELAEEIYWRADAHRAGDEERVSSSKMFFERIPWPFRRPLIRFITWLVYELGVTIGPFRAAHHPFGSIILTNVGSLGLSTAMVALFPPARLPAAVAMGKMEEKPVVRDGKIVIRTILPVTGTFDHRIVDGEQAGKLVRAVTRYLENPELVDAKG
jgi:pyruvate/2-oxoglutarate dehydrogenase complex dihydrolipoamide acyltransferase (E2) component